MRSVVGVVVLLLVTPALAQPVEAPTSEPPALTGETYAVRLADLERRIEELKQRIWSAPPWTCSWPPAEMIHGATLDVELGERAGPWELTPARSREIG